jgi:hypothetical protein
MWRSRTGANGSSAAVRHQVRTGGRLERRALALALGALGFGLAVVAVLGPLMTGEIEYHVTETLRNQTIGLDAVSLFLVAPISMVAAVLVLRNHVAGAALALGVGAYTSYMFVQYILGPEYERLPGDNERLFPLYLLLFAFGWLVVLAAWNALEAERLPSSRDRDRSIGAIVLPVLAFLAFVRYLPALADWMSGTPDDPGYLAGPTFAWAIAMLDLGVFLPATIVTCAGLLRSATWSGKALFTVIGWFALVGTAVAAMGITMYINDDPNASGPGAVMMTVLGVAFAIVALSQYLPLFSSAKRDAR